MIHTLNNIRFIRIIILTICSTGRDENDEQHRQLHHKHLSSSVSNVQSELTEPFDELGIYPRLHLSPSR